MNLTNIVYLQMAPPHWATGDQYDFFRSRRAEFQQHQKAKTLTTFWDNVVRDWFCRWPESSPGSNEITREEDNNLDNNSAKEADGSARVRKVPICC